MHVSFPSLRVFILKELNAAEGAVSFDPRPHPQGGTRYGNETRESSDSRTRSCLHESRNIHVPSCAMPVIARGPSASGGRLGKGQGLCTRRYAGEQSEWLRDSIRKKHLQCSSWKSKETTFWVPAGDSHWSTQQVACPYNVVSLM